MMSFLGIHKSTTILKSLKKQLLLIFSFFTIISILTAWYTSYYYVEKGKIAQLSQEVTSLEIRLLKVINKQESFYNLDMSNSLYFETGESLRIKEFREEFNYLIVDVKYLLSKDLDVESIRQIKVIEKKLKVYNGLFTQMILAITKRGFKNYGIEGKMREAVHKLEAMKEVKLEEVLMLRRNEKDFIIRQELVYVINHKRISKRLISEIKNNGNIGKERKQKVITILKDYIDLFDQIVSSERIIGIKTNIGLRKDLNNQITDLFVQLKQLESLSFAYQETLQLKLNYSIGMFWLLYLAGAIISGLTITKHFTSRLNTLSRRINVFVNTGFSSRLELSPQKREDEVGKLWNNIITMEGEIVDYINLFREKVDEKTIELVHKTEKIEIQKKELTIQKEESDKRNKDLLDSMRYAWRIQQALIPTEKRFGKNIGKGFVYFVPKDIVSGDIYWTHSFRKKGKGEIIFSTIDCTGHGVPGAFMSILAVSAINFAILNKGNTEPDKVLEVTNNYVFNTLKYYNGNSNGYTTKDGMDMLLCKLDRKTLTLEYAGANRPLYIVRKHNGVESEVLGLSKDLYRIKTISNAVIFEIKATKKSVGVLEKKDSKLYINNRINVREGDMLYLTSDGFADQFGGEKNKKFMISRLKGLFALIHDLEESEQKLAIHQTMQDWRGNEEQVDDITIMGVRV